VHRGGLEPADVAMLAIGGFIPHPVRFSHRIAYTSRRAVKTGEGVTGEGDGSRGYASPTGSTTVPVPSHVGHVASCLVPVPAQVGQVF